MIIFEIWSILCAAFLLIGTIITFILLANYKSNKPAIISFGITLLLCFICLGGIIVTKPEEQIEEYKYCPYCGEEVEWREVK